MTYEPTGYFKLASLMSREKDVAIFRRFDDLNILSLLELQAEIVDLEKDLRRQRRADETMGNGAQQQPPGQPDPSYYSGNFKLSRESNSGQYSKLKSIREKLKEYSWSWLVPVRSKIYCRATNPCR